MLRDLAWLGITYDEGGQPAHEMQLIVISNYGPLASAP